VALPRLGIEQLAAAKNGELTAFAGGRMASVKGLTMWMTSSPHRANLALAIRAASEKGDEFVQACTISKRIFTAREAEVRSSGLDIQVV
jgi:hypothetical protein